MEYLLLIILQVRPTLRGVAQSSRGGPGRSLTPAGTASRLGPLLRAVLLRSRSYRFLLGRTLDTRFHETPPLSLCF